MNELLFIDSHTAGEPTRVILEGGPPLGGDSLVHRRETLQREFDYLRKTVILEPRGSDVLVGALLCEPVDPTCAAGVIFFNNKGYLGMCGHGLIGVAATLAHLGRISLGHSRIETPVGVVEVNLLTPNRVAIENVPAYRYRKQVEVQVPDLGTFHGDVAWGGNWFYLVEGAPYPLELTYARELSDAAWRIRQSLGDAGITGKDGAEIDHVEFFGPPTSSVANSRNFVMCPGGAFDRSPCGTGTSAKLACLAANGKLAPNETWVQESIIGSQFEARYRRLDDDRIVPTITGEAYITAEGRIISDTSDPYRHGISAEAAV